MPEKLRRPTLKDEIKMVVLGSSAVGKSALTVRFVQGQFIEKYDPTIEDSYQKIIEVPISEDKSCDTVQRCNLEILDTAGTDQFAAMRELYLKNGDAFLLVYSVTSASSFHELSAIYEQVVKSNPKNSERVVLVGNKCDLVADRVISKNQGEELAKSWNAPFYETSALIGTKVDEAFLLLPARLVRETLKAPLPAKKKSSCIIC